MTSTQQRTLLQRQIWQIANEVRGSVDGWDFKQYVLGTLFYRFISENFTYIEGGDDSVITDEIIEDAVKTKGYFISPKELFVNVAATANQNDNLNTDLANIFSAIESSANGYPSEVDIKGLFADFDTTTQFIGASGEDFFKKEANNNVMHEKLIDAVMQLFDSKANVDQLRSDIDAIVNQIEGA